MCERERSGGWGSATQRLDISNEWYLLPALHLGLGEGLASVLFVAEETVALQ